ncbi:MAG: tetratricopeptide repeat protein [Candidatus Acidiferrales bacterium]
MFAVLLFAVLAINATFAQEPPAAAQKLAHQARDAGLRGNWLQAVAGYEKAVQLAPRNPIFRAELGVALIKSGRPADAIAVYQEALRISPRNVSAEVGLAQAYRGVHNHDQARRTLERAIREHPKAAAPLAVLGDLEIELQTYDAAIGHLRAALALDPSNTDARDRLASSYRSKGDSESALAQIENVLARDPQNALAFYLRAEIYSDRNQDDRALPDAQKVVELQPQNPRGRILLGKILVRTPEGAPAAEVTDRCSRAVEILKPLVGAQANDSETLFLLSRAYRCAGNSEEAQKTLAAFEAASQGDRSAKENEAQARHLVQEANERALKNDLPGALDLLHQALGKFPNFGAAYSQLAKLYYSAGDVEKASEAISHALELEPFQPDFLYVQGKVFERQGKFDEALASFERTALVNPMESDAYFEIGILYEKRNDRARALAAYKKALELSPDDDDYRRALTALAARKSSP